MISQGHAVHWWGCYRNNADLWVPDAYSHPAKMAPALCHRIVGHLEELGLLKPGMTVLDPMAGIFTTGLVAASRGYRAIGVELEEKFVGLAKANVAALGMRLGRELDATVIHGDARKLCTLLQERGLAVITSPPYAEAQTGGGIMNTGYTPQSTEGKKRHPNGQSPVDWVSKRTYSPDMHGSSPGQIGNLPDRPVVITSPPYGDCLSDWKNKDSNLPGQYYNAGFGNLGNLPESLDPGKLTKADWWRKKALERCSETYLDAMRLVYAEIAKVADVLAVVTKNPTRNGQLRRLDLDTISLLEATGWRIVCRHEAMLFEETEQAQLFGGTKKQPKGRISFFKRLSYAKGAPVADHEDVIIAVQTGNGGCVVITSPPYQDNANMRGGIDWEKANRLDRLKPSADRYAVQGMQDGYGASSGQIGNLE